MKTLPLQKIVILTFALLISQLSFSQNNSLIIKNLNLKNQIVSTNPIKQKAKEVQQLKNGKLLANRKREAKIKQVKKCQLQNGKLVGKASLLGLFLGLIFGGAFIFFNRQFSNLDTLFDRKSPFSVRTKKRQALAYQYKLDLYLKYR